MVNHPMMNAISSLPKWVRDQSLKMWREIDKKTSAAGLVMAIDNEDPPGFTYSLRHLAFLTIGLLLGSQYFLQRECLMALGASRSASQPILRRWRVLTKRKELEVLKSPSGGWLTNLEPHQEVEFFGNGTDEFHQVLKPSLGWTRKVNHEGNKYFKLSTEQPKISSTCPLLYSALPTPLQPNRYSNAPFGLTLSQVLWNAVQVLHLFLLVSVLYDFSQPTLAMDSKWKRRRLMAAYAIAIISIPLIPFSIYVISPGGFISSILTVGLALLAILTPVHDIRFSVGEKEEEPYGDPSCRPWLLIREETLCALCYFGSSLYNAASAVNVWPHFRTLMNELGDFIHWPTPDADATPEELFDFFGFFSSARMPPFVPRANGHHFRGHVYVWVWTVLPFLYATNFLVMIALSRRSPGKWIQRALCCFGLFHFLFGTDFVGYRYGRGFRSNHEELFHWAEKWSWRFGIHIPLYQAVTNGHWGARSHPIPLVGLIHRYLVIIWGIVFFFLQTIQADIPKTYWFLMGKRSKGSLFAMMGLTEYPFFRNLRYPYFQALTWMWMHYIALHLLCFKLMHISIRRATTVAIPTQVIGEEEETEDLLHNATDSATDSGIMMTTMRPRNLSASADNKDTSL